MQKQQKCERKKEKKKEREREEEEMEMQTDLGRVRPRSQCDLGHARPRSAHDLGRTRPVSGFFFFFLLMNTYFATTQARSQPNLFLGFYFLFISLSSLMNTFLELLLSLWFSLLLR